MTRSEAEGRAIRDPVLDSVQRNDLEASLGGTVVRTSGCLAREVDIHLVETPAISPPHDCSKL